MSMARRGQGNVEGSTLKWVRRTPREEEIVLMHLSDGLLLAYYEEGQRKICKEVSWLLGSSQFDPHPP